MTAKTASVQITRWSGGQHPNILTITRIMKEQGLRPYMWMNIPNSRYAVRSHGYHKVLYILEGTIELVLPDSNQTIRLRAGDRADIPAGVRHGTIVGANGAKCVEATFNNATRR